MSTTRGAFIRNSPNSITAIFVIDDIQRTFAATVSPSVPPFTANSATLTYDDPDLLTSTRSYSGHIGPNTYELNIANGPKITGDLIIPGVSPASIVDGSGTWEES
ncbi:hypothetical protein F5144DRAFT_125073 [Chaetomium tenue]|uniref:Uncharacterized protein n=1 Tax=Chaetomium tenue TaxID=1854479 RepID=A0ACB7PGX1_9PEZI|nr:hypothetical protein F5144DRAFT_125073 [Chaetomium globosum]